MMERHSGRTLAHLTDHALLTGLDELLRQGHRHTARLLTYLGEVDARTLFAAHGHPSMFRFCVDQLHMSEGTAYKRIGAARMARRHPEVLEAIAEGRLHLSGALLLAPHVNAGNLRELLTAATHLSKAAIEHMLAERFPRPDLPTRVRMLAPNISGNELSPGTVPMPSSPNAHEEASCPALHETESALATGLMSVGSAMAHATPSPCIAADSISGPAHSTATSNMPVGSSAIARRARVTPTAPQRYALQTTLDEQAHADLRAIQAMLSHAIPSHDLGEVLSRALALCREVLEKQRTRATETPREPRTPSTSRPRHIAAHVRREVWRRDGHRCTFIGPDGDRCAARSFLELDHILPIARGGQSSVDNLRVRCRAHNQHEAERMFGVAFMRAQRERASGHACISMS